LIPILRNTSTNSNNSALAQSNNSNNSVLAQSNNSNNSALAQSSNSNSLRSIETLNGDSAKRLLECPICMEHIKDFRLNCGHMLCNMCAQNVTECPTCMEHITQRDRVYYNKYLKYKQKYLQLKKQ
jgi:hypothetical protein